jgi:hypothetical protein
MTYVKPEIGPCKILDFQTGVSAYGGTVVMIADQSELIRRLR